MAQLICPIPGSPCFDPASPLINTSSEQEDSASWISRFRGSQGTSDGSPFSNPNWPVWPRTDWPDFCQLWPWLCDEFPDTFIPETPGVNLPPLGSFWLSEACGDYYVSLVSQEDADRMAQLASIDCLPDLWPPTEPPNTPGDTTPRQIYSSRAATCSLPCPGGASFSYTVRAGYYRALDQVTADRMAYSLACKLAQLNRFCLSSMVPDYGCIGTQASHLTTMSPAGGTYTFEIIDGSLPPGLSIDESPPWEFLITGTPTTAGTYPFTLRATNAQGLKTERTFTIKIFGIQNASPLPEYTVGVYYTETLVALGPIDGAVKWTVVSGSLPTGLSLNEDTGVISGTPT